MIVDQEDRDWQDRIDQADEITRRINTKRLSAVNTATTEPPVLIGDCDEEVHQ